MDSQLFYKGEDISLNAIRQDLAIYMYENWKCDIIGRNWPANIKVLVT
jgi:hypothetical protein